MNLKTVLKLSCDHQYVYLKGGLYDLRFKSPKGLEAFVDIVHWDDGYLVVKAQYSHQDEAIEDYIDVRNLLEDLGLDADFFLKSVTGVEIETV